MGVQERQSHDKQICQISEKNYKNKQSCHWKLRHMTKLTHLQRNTHIDFKRTWVHLFVTKARAEEEVTPTRAH